MTQEQPRRYETLLVERTGGAVTITLNRPERMNALAVALCAELLPLLRELAADDSVRAVMITGSGRAFCTGADLKDAQTSAAGAGSTGGTLDTNPILRDWYHPIMTTIREMPKPVVAAVNGAAAGAGASLALAADLVVARESAYFLLAFVNIGLVPDGGSSVFVPARVGFARAAEMALLGERVKAPQAVEWGLINLAYPDDSFEEQARALLERLAAGPTRAYAGAKRELNQRMYAGLAEQLELEASLQAQAAASRDCAEGVAAFLEKRRAAFTGE